MSIARQQAEILSEQFYPHANYLIQLRERATVKLSPADSMYEAIVKAQDAIQKLCTRVHYLSCASGVGRPPAADGEQREAEGKKLMLDSDRRPGCQRASFLAAVGGQRGWQRTG